MDPYYYNLFPFDNEYYPVVKYNLTNTQTQLQREQHKNNNGDTFAYTYIQAFELFIYGKKVAENDTKKKLLGDHYTMIWSKIKGTEIPKSAPSRRVELRLIT
jgi:hypothetical protein